MGGYLKSKFDRAARGVHSDNRNGEDVTTNYGVANDGR